MRSLWLRIHIHKREPVHDKNRNGTWQHIRVYRYPESQSSLLHRPQYYIREHCSLVQTSSGTISSIYKNKQALPCSWKNHICPSDNTFFASLSKRSRSKGQRAASLPILHIELWVALRRDRARMRQITRKIYRIARQFTEDEGGSGPRVFLVEQDPPNPKTPRLRSILGLRPQEDLWVELTSYPNKVHMKRIIRKIWKQPQFIKHASKIESLLSKRKVAHQGTLAYAALQDL